MELIWTGSYGGRLATRAGAARRRPMDSGEGVEGSPLGFNAIAGSNRSLDARFSPLGFGRPVKSNRIGQPENMCRQWNRGPPSWLESASQVTKSHPSMRGFFR
jgi:hypothetical protein